MNTESTEQAEANADAEFAAAFSEATADNQAPSETSAPANGGQAEGQGAAGTSAPELSGTTEADGTGTDAATNAPSSANPKDTDIWADAPQQVRSAYEAEKAAWERKIAGSNGRASGLQKQLDALRRQQEQQATTEKKGPDASEILASEEVKRLREDYGEIADPILSVVQPLVDEINSLKSRAQSADTAQAASFEAVAMETLNQAHPDWMQTLNGNKEIFEPWLEAQPRHIREAFERNRDSLTDPDEAIDVVDRFKNYLTASADPQNQQIGAKRASQLAAGQSVRTRAPTASSQIPDDFEAGFLAASRT